MPKSLTQNFFFVPFASNPSLFLSNTWCSSLIYLILSHWIRHSFLSLSPLFYFFLHLILSLWVIFEMVIKPLPRQQWWFRQFKGNQKWLWNLLQNNRCFEEMRKNMMEREGEREEEICSAARDYQLQDQSNGYIPREMMKCCLSLRDILRVRRQNDERQKVR